LFKIQYKRELADALNPAVPEISRGPQTWWGNIDKTHTISAVPDRPVTPGGISDRLLSEYGNVYGDLSAHSGLNALLRDEAHVREFLKRSSSMAAIARHDGGGSKCYCAQQQATVRRLAPDQQAIRKMLYGNASRVLKIA
jgi:hypothetical protein